ncbi:MAG TPA: DUF2341 domain-containing protein, partial [Candidatus Paceibacterota bacterium]|nr:DUF2341 domain-containing protein [Candidatus Paceibacterota bacterium]
MWETKKTKPRKTFFRLLRWVVGPLCIAALLAGSYFYFPFGNNTAPQIAKAAWYSASWSNRIKLTVNAGRVVASATTTVFLTTGTTWTVPSNWPNASNTIEVIGGGGGGSRGGGGGGAYAKAVNVTLTPSGSVTYQVGSGAAGVDPANAAGAGGDTYFCNSTSNCASISGSAVVAGAKGGAGASTVTAGSGGASGSGVGSVKNSGGNGGNGVSYGGGGGGGAAGPNGIGADGGLAAQTVGGGGGGANGGSAGQAGGSGANGGANRLGSGSGAYASGAGSNGGGGGGGGQTGGAGGAGTEWDATHGSGGGGGGTGDTNQSNNIGGAGGLYGAGGGGTEDSSGSGRVGGNGAQGIIVIQYAGSPTQTNFPVYVNLADLPATVWSTMRSDCGDIRITSSDGSTEVPREIVSCNNGSKTGELWFKAPSVSSGANTDFYIYYGNSGASDYATNATYGAQNVWTNGYVGVYHLKDGTTLSGNDSTGNANTGSITGATAGTGQVDGAANLSGTSQYITIGNGSSLQITGDMTIQAWINPTDNANYNGIVGKTNANVPGPYDFYLVQTTGVPRFFRGNGTVSTNVDGTTAVSSGVWSFIAVTMSGTSVTHYLNANTNGSGTLSTTIADSGTSARIGSRADSATMFKGSMDEVRISNTARSASWIQTEYNNQSSPSTFYYIGDAPNSTKVYLTSGTTWTVPSDWNSASNTIEVIGGGGGGAGYTNQLCGPDGGGGGGGYSKISNLSLTPGASITYAVGSAGAGSAGCGAGSSGGDSWFNAASMAGCVSAGPTVCVGAKGGQGGQTSGVAGTGGSSASGVGTTKYSGGSGGAGGGGSANSSGGGAAGPQGNGGAGNISASASFTTGGAGGGGAGGGGSGTNGSAGGTPSGSTGGAGGNNAAGVGGGAAATGGTNGGGGGGSSSATAPGNGGAGADWDATHGAGGGGGSSGGNFNQVGANGGLYGGGGGSGGGWGSSGSRAGGNGAQGIIVITYTPSTYVASAPTSTSFLVAPAAASISSITMTATSTDQGGNIEDINGPIIQYFFSLSAC